MAETILKKCAECGIEFYCEEALSCWCNKGLWGTNRDKSLMVFNSNDECLCPFCLSLRQV